MGVDVIYRVYMILICVILLNSLLQADFGTGLKLVSTSTTSYLGHIIILYSHRARGGRIPWSKWLRSLAESLSGRA